MKLVGLTGGIACGKSVASNYLKQTLGFPVIDCDAIAFEVVKKVFTVVIHPNPKTITHKNVFISGKKVSLSTVLSNLPNTQGHWGFHRVVAAFPEHDILREDGEIDRRKLGDVIFSNPDARKRLNRATHLPVLFEILRQAAWYWATLRPVVIVDMPLLFETGFYRVCHERILIRCSGGVQLRRLQSRDGLGVEEAQARINAQMPLESKVKLATMVIDNDADGVEMLQRRMDEVASLLQRRSLFHQLALSPIGVVLLGIGIFYISH